MGTPSGLESLAIAACALLAVGQSARAEPPRWSNIVDSDLGDPQSTMSLELVHVPYFTFERLLVDVTIRNPTSSPLMLPQHIWLRETVEPAEGPNTIVPGVGRFGIERVRHACCPAGCMDPLDGRNHCLDRIRSSAVQMAPGESKTMRWVSKPLLYPAAHSARPLERPVTYGFRLEAHGVVPDRWLRFVLHPFADPIRHFIVRHPGEGTFGEFWWATEAGGNVRLLGLFPKYGSRGYRPDFINPTAADLNREFFSAQRFTRYYGGIRVYDVYPSMSIDIRMGPDRSVLIDGKVWQPPYVIITQGQPGWSHPR